MAKRSLAELQAAFSQKTNAQNTAYNQDWKKFYQFWKMKVDETAVVRFLPDLNEENEFGFLVENLTHEFNINGKRETVACLSMYGEHCPVCEASRQFYAEEGDNSTRGKKYYRKKSHIGQVLVVESPIEHDQDQLVKLIEFGPKIFKLIQAAFKDAEMENPPYEFKGGYNFKIKKSQAGQYADYGTSSFSGRSTDVSDDVIAALDLYNLSDYRAKKVDADTIRAMLEADMHGGSVQAPATTAPATRSVASNAGSDDAVSTTKVVAPAPQAEVAESSGSNADYLAQIRARAAAKKAAAAAGE